MIYLTKWNECGVSGQKNAHIMAHELLTYALEREYGIKEGYRLKKGRYGKPYLADYPSLFFNLSHSGNVAVCCLLSVEHGVDIEQPRLVREGILKKALTECEREQFQMLMETEGYTQMNTFLESEMGKRWFLRFWTLKESYIKADGRGLSCPLKEAEFYFTEAMMINFKREMESMECQNRWNPKKICSNHSDYEFFQRELPDKTVIALACRRDMCKKRKQEEEISTIFKNIITI